MAQTNKVQISFTISEADAIEFEVMRQKAGIRSAAGFARMLTFKGMAEISGSDTYAESLRRMYKVVNNDVVSIYRKAFETVFYKVSTEMAELDLVQREKDIT